MGCNFFQMIKSCANCSRKLENRVILGPYPREVSVSSVNNIAHTISLEIMKESSVITWIKKPSFYFRKLIKPKHRTNLMDMADCLPDWYNLLRNSRFLGIRWGSRTCYDDLEGTMLFHLYPCNISMMDRCNHYHSPCTLYHQHILADCPELLLLEFHCLIATNILLN